MKRIFRKLIYKVFNLAQEVWQQEFYAVYYSKYNLPSSFRFNGRFISIYGKGKFIAGEHSYVGSNSTFQVAEGHSIQIGTKCRISHNVRVYTRSLSGDVNLSIAEKFNKGGNVIIGNYVWIGANVFINPGIHIGDNSVVGANSVVTKNIPPNSIVGGVPAKLIKYKD